jgi:hypothetical protein
MSSGGEEVSEVWIDETKTFNSDLGLYEIEVKSDDGVGKKVYWQERKGKGVSLTIKCLYFKTGATSCEFNTHQPNYGFNTSYITINFHSELLPHWQEIYQDAEQLIHSFKVEKNKMKHPKSIDRTYAQRCLDDLRIALMSDSTCPLLKQKIVMLASIVQRLS